MLYAVVLSIAAAVFAFGLPMLITWFVADTPAVRSCSPTVSAPHAPHADAPAPRFVATVPICIDPAAWNGFHPERR